MRHAAIALLLLVGQTSQKPQADLGPNSFTFEVAAVKRNPSGEVNGTLALRPGGYFRATNFDAFNLVAFAFRTKPRNLFRSQVIGAPDWMSTERYDINARMSRELFDSTADDPLRTPKIVRALLEDRFHLRAHREMRDMPVYALVATPKFALRPVDVDCEKDRTRCSVKFLAGHLTAGAITMETLAAMLSSETQRLTTDRTGLAKRYDIDLEWASETASDKASIFTALQEQLGLKLESTHEPVDVVVIDHVERPTED